MKDFIIIGNKNGLTWRDTFPLYMKGICRYGYTRPNNMIVPYAVKYNKIENGNKIVNMQGLTKWITTLPVKILNPVVPVHNNDYNYIDNTDIINVDSIYSIPADYNGKIAVPIDILSYLPENYTVIGKLKTGTEPYDMGKPIVDNKIKYVRIIIKRK